MKTKLLSSALLALCLAAHAPATNAQRRAARAAVKTAAAAAGSAERTAAPARTAQALTKTAEARQLIARHVQKAGQQEPRLGQLAQEKQAASDERARPQAQLDAALRALALERDLAMQE